MKGKTRNYFCTADVVVENADCECSNPRNCPTDSLPEGMKYKK